MANPISFSYKNELYQAIRQSDGWDIYSHGEWIGWTAGTLRDVRDTVKSMVAERPRRLDKPGPVS